MMSLFEAREVRRRELRDDALFLQANLAATSLMPEETRGTLSSWDICLGEPSHR